MKLQDKPHLDGLSFVWPLFARRCWQCKSRFKWEWMWYFVEPGYTKQMSFHVCFDCLPTTYDAIAYFRERRYIPPSPSANGGPTSPPPPPPKP